MPSRRAIYADPDVDIVLFEQVYPIHVNERAVRLQTKVDLDISPHFGPQRVRDLTQSRSAGKQWLATMIDHGNGRLTVRARVLPDATPCGAHDVVFHEARLAAPALISQMIDVAIRAIEIAPTGYLQP